MSKQNIASHNSGIQSDEDIRRLVILRLNILSPDEAISIGSLGSFTRDEMIAHVEMGDEIGKTLESIEMNWIRSLKDGNAPYENDRDEAGA